MSLTYFTHGRLHGPPQARSLLGIGPVCYSLHLCFSFNNGLLDPIHPSNRLDHVRVPCSALGAHMASRRLSLNETSRLAVRWGYSACMVRASGAVKVGWLAGSIVINPLSIGSSVDWSPL
ncbi:hypothetical protein Q3G72_006014 [Acer saccharum]|nr:hypothetical protein Q3G72_006014 [Acer saccharum]